MRMRGLRQIGASRRTSVCGRNGRSRHQKRGAKSVTAPSRSCHAMWCQESRCCHRSFVRFERRSSSSMAKYARHPPYSSARRAGCEKPDRRRSAADNTRRSWLRGHHRRETAIADNAEFKLAHLTDSSQWAIYEPASSRGIDEHHARNLSGGLAFTDLDRIAVAEHSRRRNPVSSVRSSPAKIGLRPRKEIWTGTLGSRRLCRCPVA